MRELDGDLRQQDQAACIAVLRFRADVCADGGLATIEVDILPAQAQELAAPRAVWVMLPAGAPTENTVMRLGELLSAGDVIIDGGNSKIKTLLLA